MENLDILLSNGPAAGAVLAPAIWLAVKFWFGRRGTAIGKPAENRTGIGNRPRRPGGPSHERRL